MRYAFLNLLLVTGGVALLTACPAVVGRGGVEAMPDARVGGVVQGIVGIDGGRTRVAALAVARLSASYGDLGAGMEVCMRPRGWSTPMYCGRIVGIELGANRGRFSMGVLSPEMSVGWWRPLEKKRARKRLPVSHNTALEIQVHLGLHVRPLHDWAGTTPYLLVTFGGGLGASDD